MHAFHKSRSKYSRVRSILILPLRKWWNVGHDHTGASDYRFYKSTKWNCVSVAWEMGDEHAFHRHSALIIFPLLNSSANKSWALGLCKEVFEHRRSSVCLSRGSHAKLKSRMPLAPL